MCIRDRYSCILRQARLCSAWPSASETVRTNANCLCPINVPVLSAVECHSCAHTMPIGDDSIATQLCPRTVIKDFKVPVLHEGTSGEFWVYSLPKMTRVNIQCINSRNSLQATTSEVSSGVTFFGRAPRKKFFRAPLYWKKNIQKIKLLLLLLGQIN